jgi:hypothetical protein
VRCIDRERTDSQADRDQRGVILLGSVTGVSGEYTYPGSLLRVGLSQSTKTIDWQAEVAVPFVLGLPTDAVAPAAPRALVLAWAETRSHSPFWPMPAPRDYELGEPLYEFLNGDTRIAASLAQYRSPTVTGVEHLTREFDYYEE